MCVTCAYTHMHAHTHRHIASLGAGATGCRELLTWVLGTLQLFPRVTSTLNRCYLSNTPNWLSSWKTQSVKIPSGRTTNLSKHISMKEIESIINNFTKESPGLEEPTSEIYIKILEIIPVLLYLFQNIEAEERARLWSQHHLTATPDRDIMAATAKDQHLSRTQIQKSINKL